MRKRNCWQTSIQAAKQSVRSGYVLPEQWTRRHFALNNETPLSPIKYFQRPVEIRLPVGLSHSSSSSSSTHRHKHDAFASITSWDAFETVMTDLGACAQKPAIFHAPHELLTEWTLVEYWKGIEQQAQQVSHFGGSDTTTVDPFGDSATSSAITSSNLDTEVIVGEDDEGYSVCVDLRSMIRYVKNNSLNDDDPLLMFQEQFDEIFTGISSTFQIPTCFQWTEAIDPLSKLPQLQRPPYNWLLFGGPRSGTPLHVDPYGSCAWNALVKGKKRWLCFHPSLEPLVQSQVQAETYAMTWYTDYYEDFVQAVRNESSSSSSSSPLSHLVFEWIQHPGQVVYIPKGWYHMVLNVAESLAVTYNFTTEANDLDVS